MRRAIALVCFFASLGVVLAQQKQPYAEHIASTGPLTPADERKAFHLPPGFDIELVAAEPDIHKPMNIAFDARGRVWVTESVEYPFPARGGKPRDAVKILDDFGPDGRARKITTFAGDLNIPIGVLPVGSSALVYTIPNIVRLTDTDGDGKADRREVLYEGYGYRDTHGMTNSFTWGFDGWIYASHGFSNTSNIKARDGSSITVQSGNTYRIKPDGSHIEQFTHGQVNPFGLCFDPLGNLFSADCHTKPVMMLLRNGYYESFGKPHDGLGFAPEMCKHDHGSTAIAGIVYYAADHFLKQYHDNIWVGNVVTNRINQDKLERHGSTYIAVEQPDFLKSDDPWFRPVDLKLGPDGALYVADFYNRIIGHYEVPLDHPGRDRERGRIWRIVYRGPDGKGKAVSPCADFTNASVAELVKLLGNANLTVRTLATNQLVERQDSTIVSAVRDVLKPESSPWQLVHALWVLERRGALDEKTLESAAKDKDATVRTHAMRVLSERKNLSKLNLRLVNNGLRDKDAFAQRAAADALGQHPSAANVRRLLNLRHAVPADDTELLHTVRMALRDQLRLPDVYAGFRAELKLALSEKDRRALADVSTGVPSADAAAFLLQHIQTITEKPADLLRYVHHVARFGSKLPDAAALVAFVHKQQPDNLDFQAALYKAVQQGVQEAGAKLSEDAKKWADELIGRLLADSQSHRVSLGIELAGTRELTPKVEEYLIKLANNREVAEANRLAAVNALSVAQPARYTPLLGRLVADAGEPIALREGSANALARINHADAQTQLVLVLPAAPARLQSVIAIGLAGTRPGGEKLLEAVAAGKASARLLLERPVALRLGNARIPDLKNRLASLTVGLPKTDDRLDELQRRRRAGFASAKADPTVGQNVYEKHCAACHQLAGKGAKIGPQLDGIGIRGVDRLLEDILDPNRNVDQAFRSTTLTLKNGQVVTGLLLKEEGEVLVLADAQGKEVRVPKQTVDEKNVTQLSPMPANLVDQITEPELYHLLAFLLKQRPEKK